MQNVVTIPLEVSFRRIREIACQKSLLGFFFSQGFYNAPQPRPPNLFLTRDAMRKRNLCYRQLSVCLSVCPSVCHVGALYADGCRYRQTSFSAR